MRGLTWIRCYIDDQGNRVWVALRGTPTGFDVLITLLKTNASTPVTQTSKAGIATIGEATQHFEKCCDFYDTKGYHKDTGFERMLEDLLNK